MSQVGQKLTSTERPILADIRRSAPCPLSIDGRARPRARRHRDNAGLGLAVELGAAAIIPMNVATLVLGTCTRITSS
jgi:hypothetical protein